MKHQDLIASLTLEEKCALLSGGSAFRTRGMEAHGIPEMQFSDGPHGLRLQGADANHLGLGSSMPATCFPTATTVANSWDPSLGERLGECLGEECLAEKVDVILGPGLCIKRSPLCGRDFEYFSEDPFLAGKMAASYVRGIQGTGVSACPKHFAVNSQETRRQASDSVLDERTLREIYLSAFETVVRESHPMCLMSSYNRVNGTFANENPYLLKQILRDEWGFDGAVVTDWGGSNDHAAGVSAGSTFEMPDPGLSSVRDLMAAVSSGEVSVSDLDARVDEAIELILTTTAATSAASDEFDMDAHHQVAREIAAQSIVLLKNDAPTPGAGPLLPLAAGTKVALVGDFAATPRYQGAGSSLVNCTKLDSLLDLMPDSGLTFVGYEKGFERHGGEGEALASAAVDLSRKADVVVVCLGLDEQAESEGADRTTMRLNDNQVALLHRVAEANPNVVVLLSGGSAVESGWVVDAASVLYLALGGQAGADAALDVLLGRQNPSGRLNETWPVSLTDTPTAATFPAEGAAAEYREGIYVGYRYYRTAGVPVAYPFGFGLSYTTFSYSDLEVTPTSASFVVTNDGPVAGSEVCQLYVSKPVHDVFRADEELKGFAKVTIAAGGQARVTIPLDERSFSYFDVGTGRWEIEAGTYEVRIGSSSADIRLVGTVEQAGTGAADPYAGKDLAAYDTADVTAVADAQFEALLGHALPEGKVALDRNICFCDLIHGRSPIFWLVWLVLFLIKRASERSGRPNLNVLFIWNMPLRALAKNAGVVFSMGAVDGLVMEIKGFWVVGLVRCIAGIVANLVKNATQGSRLASTEKASD
ncbi:MAG: glycoside hydrolase family 3 C-terminal domain-containing protein [Atopobiaceae bacterium]|jgi:beta-glucosidase|nr:glycoside hydrolase family 3 C-terminal domain-containing protein [Atopobiaceae bacterium]MCI2173826.1 glycoside hydrolase family 3 C-terminal domain-containing protein [Atopobiaceae bacterium]MCI2207532.1 glycoside hydrolase family 3 C-terminal domain-containing protein [Atopobiaceae bacterium]